jgi:hypothetical protein
VDGGKEIPGGFVVERCDRGELLEFAEEILDQVALFCRVLDRIRRVSNGLVEAGLRRLCQPRTGPVSAIGIEGAICDQQVAGHMRQQRISPGQAVRLSRRQQQARRIAERVDQRMDLRAQPSASAAECLVLNFF